MTEKLKRIDVDKMEVVQGADPVIMLEESLVSITESVPQNPAITCGWHTYKGQNHRTTFGSYGDFSCIVGPSKSMKSKLKLALTACYIGGKSQNHFPDIQGHGQEGKFILDLDTEQSRFHVKRLKDNLFDMVGIEKDYEFHKSFFLRKYNPLERYQFLEYLAFESEFSGNIGLINVDGAADMIDDTNDLVLSQKLTSLFMKITSEQDCHLTTILHRTKSSNRPTGHIGSAVLKKAETVVYVKLHKDEKLEDDKNYFVEVTPEYTRNFPFKKFSFRLNKDWLPTDTKVDDEDDDFFSPED